MQSCEETRTIALVIAGATAIMFAWYVSKAGEETWAEMIKGDAITLSDAYSYTKNKLQDLYGYTSSYAEPPIEPPLRAATQPPTYYEPTPPTPPATEYVAPIVNDALLNSTVAAAKILESNLSDMQPPPTESQSSEEPTAETEREEDQLGGKNLNPYFN